MPPKSVDKKKFPFTLRSMKNFSPLSEKRIKLLHKSCDKLMLQALKNTAKMQEGTDISEEKVRVLKLKNEGIGQFLKMYRECLVMKLASWDALFWIASLSDKQIDLLNARLAHGQVIRKIKAKKIEFRDLLGLTAEQEEASKNPPPAG